MKTGFYAVFYAVISNMAIGLCFIPFLLLGWKKMRKIGTYRVLGVYWLFNGLVNLLALRHFQFSGSHTLLRVLSFYFNLAETPLILLAFACAQSGGQRKWILLVLIAFITGESAMMGLNGNNFTTNAVIIGSGLLLILVYSLTGLLGYLKRMEHTRFENSMVFVYASLLFAYGSFLIIYVFAHTHNSSHGGETDSDSFLLYYISLLLSAAVTSTGLWSYGIRKSPRGAYPLYRSYSSSSS